MIKTFLLALTLSSCLMASDDAIRKERSVMIPMRDGVHLSTDLYFPNEAREELPVVLIRTVYGKQHVIDWDPLYRELVRQGYALAIQDIRGRNESEGQYRIATGRREDGYDTVEWLTTRPWSNGKLGTVGCSYQGEAQLVLAAAKHPNHITSIPLAPASGYYKPGRAWQAFSGGVFELAQTAGWFASNGSKVFYQPPSHIDRQEWFQSPAAAHFDPAPKVDFEHYLTFLDTLPIATLLDRAGTPPSDYKLWATSNPDGPYFRNLDLVQAHDTFNIPALFIDSWYDYGPEETLEVFNLFSKNALSERAAQNQFIIMAPSTHCGFSDATENTVVGDRPLGDARIPIQDLQIRWLDHWLKGEDNGATDMPKVQYYLMGKNEWKSSPTWPPASSTPQMWYLGSGGQANSRLGDGTLSRLPSSKSGYDSFVYDPNNPVPSLGGHTCCTGSDTEAGGYDQSEIELRNDMLVYTSETLVEGLEVTGSIELVLNVSSSAVDTDFTAKLVDVYPDGRAFNIQEGALRMRYRDGFENQSLIEPDESYEIRIDLRATSNYFAPGHRIRLEVTSSNFPRWERNLNTGGNNYDETVGNIAFNTVHHSNAYPSYLLLPVVGEKE